jgi:hypothetical protein
METRIKLFASLLLMLQLAACALPGQEDPNEEFWGHYYGTSKSEDEKEKGWWDGFYGKQKPEQDAACSFYGTCKEK